ncbi:MAG: hypothetical protein P3B76_12905 [Gemmatimonadota bacterium]|nr:hypothetical protein [Gemmatimonadota bacterium]MDQ8168540.1 hypothetical protein [Gemmatimonadota bacterium]MDQ8173570.1 hypothetical protein [Gemmatimonadota bacterium]
MATYRHLGALAQDIYDTTGSSTSATARGWARRDPMNWREGFAAGTYSRLGETVIAFRGTEDTQDIIDDLLMVPIARPGAARDAVESLLRIYGVSMGPVLDFMAPRITEAVLQTEAVRDQVRRRLNRVPTEQVRAALRYFDACSPRPVAVCGHSLGGALAQVVSQQRGVTAVSFNGPFMGDIGGAAPMSSGDLIYVNAIGDPLSFMTGAMGHVPHGQLHTVRLPAFRRPPVRQDSAPTWLRVVSPALAIGADCADSARQYAETLRYLGETMLYHHSIDSLVPALSASARFASTVPGAPLP